MDSTTSDGAWVPQGLTLESILRTAGTLPPPLPDQEIHFGPSSQDSAGFRKLLAANKMPGGFQAIPMVLNVHIPYGILVLLEYRGKPRTIADVKVIDLREGDSAAG